MDSATTSHDPAHRSRARRGRSPSINKHKIEAAVASLSRDSRPLSMKEVADHLQVNVTTLYRHIGGVDGLRRIRASLSQNSLKALPSPSNLNWKQWLTILSDYYRDALSEYPDLLDFAQAALDPDFENLEKAAQIMLAYGFEARAALLAHSFLMTTITGYVQQELQSASEADAGFTPYYARLFQNLDTDSKDLPTLRSVNLTQRDLDKDTNFKAVIAYAIAGIESQPGSPSNDDKTL